MSAILALHCRINPVQQVKECQCCVLSCVGATIVGNGIGDYVETHCNICHSCPVLQLFPFDGFKLNEHSRAWPYCTAGENGNVIVPKVEVLDSQITRTSSILPIRPRRSSPFLNLTKYIIVFDYLLVAMSPSKGWTIDLSIYKAIRGFETEEIARIFPGQ